MKRLRLFAIQLKNAIHGVFFFCFFSVSPHVILAQDDGAVLSTRDVGFNQSPRNKKRSGRSVSIFDTQLVYFRFWPSVKLLFFFLQEPAKSINRGAGGGPLGM